MRQIIWIILIIVLGLFFIQCSHSTEPQSNDTTPDKSPVEISDAEKSLINSTNDFGFKLFRNVVDYDEPDKNIFISPLSVSFALGMTYNGAAEDTREAMATTLEYADLTIEQINQSYRNIIDILTGLDPYVAMQIANSIWYRTGLPVEPTFIEVNQTYFDAAVREMDFSAIWAADTINHWVYENTNGKIEKVLDPPISQEIVMFLINAVYFKGGWTLPFDVSSTTDLPFFFPDGTTEDRPFMLTDTNFYYLENDLFQAIDLPYGDEQFSMTVLLPHYSIAVDNLLAEFTAENWSAWIGQFSEENVELSLPRFKFRYDIKLNDILMAMGMGVAFDPFGANFGNMADLSQLGGNNLYISYVKHNSFVQVDEEGTEAAAVTVVGVGITSMPVDPVMAVNRPFLFVIHERGTGSVLFVGKVSDPVWED